MPVPTSPADQKRISKMLNKIQPLMENLHFRWQNEKEYEDFNEYLKVIKADVNKNPGFKFVSGKKRPFSFSFSLDTMPGAKYEIYCKSTVIGWRRTA